MSHHPLANVHPDAKIGNNVTIEPFATIKSDVVIGDDCWIGPNAVIWEGARLGKNVKVYPGASISSIPQDLKFAGEKTETFIGDNTVIREYVTISRGTADKHKTQIGSNCLLMAYVHIAHDCIIGNNCIFANTVQVAGHVVIEDWAIIGGSSAVHQFVKVGAHVMVSGGSLVRKDVPPFTKAAREPLTYCGVNTIGLRRRGFSSEKISEIQDTYRIIFLKGLNNSKALDLVDQEISPSPERDYIVDFIRSSERGVMKGFSTSSASFE
ncbi:MAG: acyl-ACP--UDP-N-acetylglucosamine O-acyltransferase [Cyclobacteriaceae bacterium]|nr:acyl-ACP--UDP-N-acetylglucosamine O-acyltransferase [Cyclobacteriaceae bacterium]